MKGATGAEFAGGSFAQFLVRILLEGKLEVNVTIGGQIYTGYVHNMDFAKRSTSIHAKVWVRGLPPKDEDDNGEDNVRVWLHADGTAEVMPDDLQDG